MGLRSSALAMGLLVIGSLSACSRNEAPQPLAADQVPQVVENAFKEAAPEAKTSATEVVNSLQGKDDVKAFFELQNLSSRSDLTPVQREAATRSMLSVNERLRSAAAQGDQRAADALQLYRSSK
ncbi:MAG: hypothetical protein U1G07_26930 [Verrucomicrobiota bacterium]